MKLFKDVRNLGINFSLFICNFTNEKFISVCKVNITKFIVKYRYGLIGTTVVHVLLFIFMSTTHIEDYKRSVPEEEILAEFDFTEEEPDYLQQEAENTAQNEALTNATADLSQEISTYTNVNRSQMDKNIENELQDLEQQFFDELKEGREEIKEIKPDRNQNNAVVKEDAKENDKASLGADVKATAGFFLEDRYDLELPAPSYICREEGVVVVDIRVNQKGDVKFTSINTDKTTTSNVCLHENALEYAKRARFNQDFNAKLLQQGYIKFVFARQ